MAVSDTLGLDDRQVYLYGGVGLLALGAVGFAVQAAWITEVTPSQRIFVMQSYFMGALTGTAVALSWVALVGYVGRVRN